ncbi:MAG: ABC transporter ATP-binding protein [Anaerolineales bacterium]|nr:ABC transporter ATP-binding protein [Anaerolineales bacterium]
MAVETLNTNEIIPEPNLQSNSEPRPLGSEFSSPAHELAISVRNISKMYPLYDDPQDRLKQSLWYALPQFLRGNKVRQFYRDFWALRDVSFEIKRGEALGVIGLNGSGKSTLLQIIAGTLAPTTGEVEVTGRVAALLELGSGFNPEFSGRENVYLNGSILGVSQEEMERRFDEVVDFAEIGEFIDQPVKLYSSGMKMRLAFSVAVTVNPDILIVDEALSVGDFAFSQKCLHHLEGLRERQMTLLLVSHDIRLIKNYCTTALYLDSGHQLALGECEAVTEAYLKDIYARRQSAIKQERKNQVTWKQNSHNGTTFGTDHGEIVEFSLWNEDEETDTFYQGDTLTLKITALVDETIANPNIVMQLRDERGYAIYGTDTIAAKLSFPAVEPGRRKIEVAFSFEVNLAADRYSLALGLNDYFSDHISFLHEKIAGALMFQVLPSPKRFHGVIDLKATCVKLPDSVLTR